MSPLKSLYLWGNTWIPPTVQVLADLVTVAIGAATIFAFFRYKDRISAAIRLLRLNHLNERREEVKKTLDLLADVPVSKASAKDVRALFGRLNGQITPLCAVVVELTEIQQTIESIALQNGKLTEPIKQTVIHTVHAQFESARYNSLGQAAGENK